MNSKFQHPLNQFVLISNRRRTFLDLEKSVGSQKSTQAIDAPGKSEKILITNKVTTSFSTSPRTPIAYVSFLRPTDFSRIKIQMLLFLLLFAPLQVWASSPKVERFSDHRNAAKISTSLLEPSLQSSNAGAALGRSSEPILLDVVLNPSDLNVLQLIAQIQGVEVRHFSEKYQRISLSVVDSELLFTLASLAVVRSIRPEYGAIVHTGSVESLADQALQSDVIRAANALEGQGQTVGILSDSIAGGPNRDANTSPAAGVAGTLSGSPSQDSGDLPAQITVFQDLAGRSDEGGAMAELVHDIAPAAAIAFNTAFISEAGFADGIDRLCQASTVVVDDILFFAEPMYQPGIVAQAASACVDSGVPYFSSAGNSANLGVRSHYVDSNPAVDNKNFPVSGEDLHDWQSGDQYLDIKLAPGASIFAVMQWNQPFDSVSRGAGAEIDLDIYLTTTPSVPTFGSNLLALSFNAQGDTGAPSGDAVEVLSFLNFSASSRTVFLSLDHFQGKQDVIPQNASTPLEFRVVFFTRGQVEIEGITDRTSAFGAPTVYGHSMAKGAVSVAAVPFFDTPVFGTDDAEFNSSDETPAIDPERFSARGGDLTTQFDQNGKFSPVSSFEPDIASVDANNTRFFGFDGGFQNGALAEPDGIPNFFGTSAAAPNAAAVAALLQQWMPPQTKTVSRKNNSSLSPAQITAIFQNTAIDVTGFRAAIGVDDVTGHGLINAPVALQRAVNRAPSFSAQPKTITVCTNAGGQAVQGWATGLLDGDFETQQLAFVVKNDNPALFGGLLRLGGQPDISVPSGTLYFRGALNASGAANITVRLTDNGGTAHGGQDTSEDRAFRIIVDAGCDDGAGELFSPGQLNFDFSGNDFTTGVGSTDLHLTINRQTALDRGVAAASNIPLDGLDAAIQSSILTGTIVDAEKSSLANTMDKIAISLVNDGPFVGVQVLLRLELSDYLAITDVDPRCAGDVITGIFQCRFTELSVGNTDISFQVETSNNQTAGIIAELSAANDLEFRDNRAATTAAFSQENIMLSNQQSKGGGALGWLSFILLGGWLCARKILL